MNLYRPYIVTVGSLLILATAPAAIHGAERKPLPFSAGETLTYDVNWSIFHAGRITARLGRESQDPRDAFVVTTTARSEGFVSVLYKVQDNFRSVFDPETLCSSRISKQINEGRRHREIQIAFDSARRLALLHERNLSAPDETPKYSEHEIPACVEDIISAFYYLRSQPMEVGENIHLAVNDGSRTTRVDAVILDREKIQTPLGTKEALRVEPRIFGTLFRKTRGQMFIWFSDDEHHYPLRVQAVLKVGTITGTLSSISQTPQPSPATAEAGPADNSEAK